MAAVSSVDRCVLPTPCGSYRHPRLHWTDFDRGRAVVFPPLGENNVMIVFAFSVVSGLFRHAPIFVSSAMLTLATVSRAFDSAIITMTFLPPLREAFAKRKAYNHPMKPTAPLRGNFSVVATTPCRGLRPLMRERTKLEAFLPRSTSVVAFVLTIACYDLAITLLLSGIVRLLHFPPRPPSFWESHGDPMAHIIEALLFAPLLESGILFGVVGVEG